MTIHRFSISCHQEHPYPIRTSNAEPLANYDSMRSPVFPVDPSTPKAIVNAVTIFVGNQWAGSDTAGDLLSADSFLHWRTTDNSWTSVALAFDKVVGNNKYFRADIPLVNLPLGMQIQYYCTLIYSPREPVFLGVADGDSAGRLSASFLTEDLALARPFIFTIGTQNEQKPFTYSVDKRTERGEWSNVFPLPNVAAHASLLRTGQVLMWGRRGIPDNQNDPEQSMNTILSQNDKRKPATCTPFFLDIPVTKNGTTTAEWKKAQAPFLPDGVAVNANLPKKNGQTDVTLPKVDGKTNANLFCSGHAFLPNGDLFVAGGHLRDFWGLDQSCIYELPKLAQGGTNGNTSSTPKETPEGAWRPIPAMADGTVMGNGRWYPTVTALPSGIPLVASGSDKDGHNNDTQILMNNAFTSIDQDGTIFDLYPRMHVASTGIVYSTSLVMVYFLDLDSGVRSWQKIDTRMDPGDVPSRNLHDYGCSVMFDRDQVVYVGGGKPPTANTDIIDLSNPKKIAWKRIKSMSMPRRQHNATVLPDGTVLVTGGTRGDGKGATRFAGDVEFNDLRPGRPVHMAELWNPKTQEWTRMASEQIDRCYHSTAVLLPDGRVLSAGGGEFQLGNDDPQLPNDDRDSHRDAQVFSPPYLFLPGPRPVIDSISTESIPCNSTFEIGTANPDEIDAINLIGLSSVTHSNNTGQHFHPLPTFSKNSSKSLVVKAPPDSNACPPGIYLLYILTHGHPSIAKPIQIIPNPSESPKTLETNTILSTRPPSIRTLQQRTRHQATGSRIEIGITPTCPYGLGACWGGAYEALSHLPNVSSVDPHAHMSGSSASVFLEDGCKLPDLQRWDAQFEGFVGETYKIRGYEAVLTGAVAIRDGVLVLLGEGVGDEVRLGVTGEEEGAYERLYRRVVERDGVEGRDGVVQGGSEVINVTITGPLTQTQDHQYTLQVRLFG
ncbi:hypothetical protein BLS_007592 [Venturia inaequalis]|uniref:Galactose oxidase-like Early set domain-containing protein n=1 Tax=Venturia inaequalis TaxID=5025 RepID=A0A8H3U9G4_VENIN|nr:hypothetical protein BLS_007592 [Venturia inaequalis]